MPRKDRSRKDTVEYFSYLSEKSTEAAGAIRELADTVGDIAGELDDLMLADVDADMDVDDGKAIVNVFGPDCLVWSKEPFDELVKRFLDRDLEVQLKGIPVWIDALEKAKSQLQTALEEAKSEQ